MPTEKRGICTINEALLWALNDLNFDWSFFVKDEAEGGTTVVDDDNIDKCF